MMSAYAYEYESTGAEGMIYESSYLGKPSIVKVRLSKRYRVPELDQRLNKQRLLQESRCMVRCRKVGILAPR
jgi:TP53 regulating kinase and related kinases